MLVLQSQKERTPLSQLAARKEGWQGIIKSDYRGLNLTLNELYLRAEIF